MEANENNGGRRAASASLGHAGLDWRKTITDLKGITSLGLTSPGHRNQAFLDLGATRRLGAFHREGEISAKW